MKKRIFAMLLVGCLLMTVGGCRKAKKTGGDAGSDEWEYSTFWVEDGDGDSTDGDNTTGGNGGGNNGGSGSAGKNNGTTGGNTGGSTDLTLSGGNARDKWVNLFGEAYVKERESYEAAHKPYQVPSSLKGTTVTFGTWINHTTTEAKYPMANFEKATGIKVKWVEIPQSGYYDKLVNMVATGTAPDVIVQNNDSMPFFLEVCQPLNKISSIDMNDPIWDQGYFNFSKFNGNVYNCNVRNSVWQTGYVLFYNKKVLQENGITTPDDYIKAGTWTWDNMVKMGIEFQNLNKSYQGIGYDTIHAAGAAGVGYLQLTNGKFTTGIQSATFKNAMSAVYAAKDKGLKSAQNASLIKGTAAGIIVDSFGMKKTGYFKGVKSNQLGFAPVPNPTGGQQYYPSHYRSYAICKGAKNAEAAGYFLRYFLDPYNYNWDDIFLSKDAQKAYLSYCSNVPFENKVFDFALCRVSFTGEGDGVTGWEASHKWESTVGRSNSAQFSTAVNTIAPEIDNAVTKANGILAGLN